MTAWLALAISLVAVAVALVIMRRMIDRHSGSAAVMDDIRREIGAILTEMNQTTERNIELVEERTAELRATLAQADRRLGALKRELERGQDSRVTYSELRRQAPVAQVPVAQAPGSPQGEGAPSRPAGEQGSSAAPAAGTTEAPLRVRVLDLYRQGIPIERIASRLGTTIGEVELIVSLSER